jgi:NitT/TauT family transport system ATP-binding protein
MVNAATAAGVPGRPEVAGGRPAVSLEFAGVSKRFDDGTLALLPVSFSALAGEFVAIVGPSGCGKSTLLRLAAGLTSPTTGTLTVGGRNVGYVFQDPTLLPWRSVRRNVELLGELHGVPKPERRATAQAAIDTVGLTGFEDKYPRALSGGMKMRASLARALTLSPDVFLFDEPFGAVDEITRERLNDELLGLFQARRFAALFVTHSVTSKKTRNAVRIAARAHYDMLRVFPFPQDSGKVARLFMNLLLLRSGYPPAIVHSTERQRYYDALKGSSAAMTQIVQEAIDNNLASVEKLLEQQEKPQTGPVLQEP